MFSIDATGGTSNMRTLAEDVVFETLRTLMPRKRSVYVDIEIRNTLKEGAYGFAYELDKVGYIEIENKPKSLYTFVETLCHECVHIKQYLNKELRNVKGKQMWKGDDCTDLAYSKQPWEQEAFSLQKDLAKAYLKAKGMSMAEAKRTNARVKAPWLD